MHQWVYIWGPGYCIAVKLYITAETLFDRYKPDLHIIGISNFKYIFENLK